MLARLAFAATRRQASALRAYAAAPAAVPRDVPEGHAKSDLRPHSCNIGLNRRRDLTLRADVKLTGKQASGQSLASVFKGNRIAVVGVPDMGAVCTKTHVPGYLAALPALKSAGVDRVLVVAPGDPTIVQAWAAKLGVSADDASAAAADSGDFARLLGVDAPSGSRVPTHRYSALVEDGILLRLHVEEKPGEVTKSGADTMVATAAEFFG